MCAGSLFDAVGYGTLLAAALHVVHVDGSRALTEIRHHTSLCQTTEEDTGTQVAVCVFSANTCVNTNVQRRNQML